MLVIIKNYIIDSDKIHAQIQENKKKEPKKQGKFKRKLQEVMEQAEAQKHKRNSNCCFIKKKLPIWELFLFSESRF
jgi:siroheme synthase (precorrin-2 oxidase/ferrochelatase)